jgi:hypothetical protein
MSRKKTRTNHRLASRIKAAQTLLFVNVFVWTCLGTYMLIDMLPNNGTMVSILAASFLYINAITMLIGARFLGGRTAWAYYVSLASLVFNVMISLIRQFGLIDTFTLIYDFLIIGMIISFGRAYLKKP